MAKTTTNAKFARNANRSLTRCSILEIGAPASPRGGMADAGDLKKSLEALLGMIQAMLGAQPDADGYFTRSAPRQFTSNQARAFTSGAAGILYGVATLLEAEQARVEAEGGDANDAMWEAHRILLSAEHLGALTALCQDFLYWALQAPIAAE